MTLADRSHIDTEQRNQHTNDIHQASVADCVAIIQQMDQDVITAIAAAQPTLIAFLNDIEKDFIGGGRLIYIGAGTSGRLGVLDASEAPPTFCVPPDRFIGIIAGGDSSLRKSSEGKEDIRDGAAKALSALELNATDTVLGVAAGGTTPYVHGALEMAQEKGLLIQLGV